MPTMGSVRVSLLSVESQLAARREQAVTGERPLGQWPTASLWLSTSQSRSRSVKWGLEDNTAWYGQVKK